MARILVPLLLMAILSGCIDQTILITSTPSDAGVYAGRSRIGSTPLTTTKDEIMPNWEYYINFSRAVIILRKPGYEDYIVKVNEIYIPEMIHAELTPLP